MSSCEWGEGFTATLWNEEFNGIPIEVVINGQSARDATLIQEENNSLRNQIRTLATAKQELARKFIEAVKAEHLDSCELPDDKREAEDVSYDIAIGHVVEALEAVAREEGIEVD